MKARKFLIVALALSMATVACSQNNAKLPDGTSAKDLLPSKAQIDSVSYLLGINFGSFLKSYDFGGDLNYAEMKKGILDFLGAEGDQTDSNFVKQFKVNPELMNDVFNGFLDKRAAYNAAIASAKEKEFFDSNAKKDGIKTTESGLQYKIVEPGSEVKPGPQDTVLVRYKGSLLNGTVFDETKGEPVQLMLNRVIPGWTEGIQLVGEGGKIKLFIPAELAYGERGQQGIEPNSTLLFDVEVVEVHPFVEKEETK